MTERIGKEFIKKTQYKFMGPPDQSKGKPQPPIELEYDKSKHIIDLPNPSSITVNDMDLRKTIENRKSVRKYSDQPLTLPELSWLLWCTQGVKEVLHRQVTLRTVPSAGARHCFETYLLVNNVEDLQSGLYRFLAVDHKLEPINLDDPHLANKLTTACLDQSMVRKSAVTFFWTSVIYRMKWRYGERGYRYLLLDAGHVCQNLYLAVQNINCGVCGVAAFNDEEVNQIIGLDGETQFVIYLATVGKVR